MEKSMLEQAEACAELTHQIQTFKVIFNLTSAAMLRGGFLQGRAPSFLCMSPVKHRTVETWRFLSRLS
jgi:hypothetical protein